MIRVAAAMIAASILAGCAAAPGLPASLVAAPVRTTQLAGGAPARGAAPGPSLRTGGTVTLDETIRLGLEWNRDIRAVRRRAGVAEAEVVTAEQFPFNPVVEASAAGDHYRGSSSEGEADIAVGLNQTFETGGQRGRRIEVAARGLDAARAEIADAERRLRQELATSFLDALLATRRLAIAEAQLELAGRLLEIAEVRRQAGDIAQVEVNLVRLEARKAEAARLGAVEQVETGRAALRALLGISAGPGPVVPEGDFPPATSPAEGDLEARALEHRPDLQAARARIERAGASAELERAARWPDLTVGAFYEFARGSIDAREGALEDKDHLIGVSVAVPLPLFNRREGEILQAEREARRLETEREALERTIAREVAIARDRLRGATARAALYDTEIEALAEANLDQMREAYRLGQVGTLEVLRAQEERFKVAVDAVEARRDRAVAAAALEAALGGTP